MPADEPSGPRPGPVVLRIKLRYDDVDAMVARFAPNVGKSGLFLPTKSLQPVGTEVKFELRIANDTPVLVGLGKVKAVRPPDPNNPKAAFGMAIELMRVTREGREVIIRMIERRRALGLADVAIPMPEDVEAAKRADVETQPRGDVSGIVRNAMPKMASAPVAEQVYTARPFDTGPVLSRKDMDSAPVIAAARESGPIGESLLTSPRPASGPIAVARSALERSKSAPVLAPEPARAKRPRISDVIAKAEASGPLAASAFPNETLDEHVDVARALARARTLAGGTDMDAELASLRESTSAPLAEISVEAASAELARQLGGVAVRRDRSARWAPPNNARELWPPHALRRPQPTPSAAASEPPAEHRVAEPSLSAGDTPLPVQRDTLTAMPEIPPDEPALPEDPDFARAPQEFARPITSSREMDQLAAEAAAAVAIQVGHGSGVIRIEQPDVAPPEPRAYETPAEAAGSEANDQIDTPPTPRPALLIDDDSDLSSFERALDAARIHTGVSAPAPPAADDEEDIAELDPADLEELPGENTHIGDVPLDEPQLSASLDQQLVAAEAEANEDMSGMHAQPAYTGDDEEFNAEEVSDLDVLAEADADDDDLLQANGEREASDSNAAMYTPPPDANRDYGPPGVDSSPEDDFAARLDLGDDPPASPGPAGYPLAPELPAFDDFNRSGDLPPNASRGHELGQFDPAFDQYTLAEPIAPPSPTFADPQGFGGGEDFDEPHHYGAAAADPQQFGAGRAQSFGDPQYVPGDEPQNFDEPHGFSSQTPPPYRGHSPQPRKHSPMRPDSDLENALSALEPDLDALEIPQEPPHPRGRPLPGMPPEREPTPVPTRAPINRLKRAVTEDEGVLIDFDDDE